eukprot:scaffold8332_cov172-Amphora_coffeaeformis.AAC.4
MIIKRFARTFPSIIHTTKCGGYLRPRSYLHHVHPFKRTLLPATSRRKRAKIERGACAFQRSYAIYTPPMIIVVLHASLVLGYVRQVDISDKGGLATSLRPSFSQSSAMVAPSATIHSFVVDALP